MLCNIHFVTVVGGRRSTIRHAIKIEIVSVGARMAVIGCLARPARKNILIRGKFRRPPPHERLDADPDTEKPGYTHDGNQQMVKHV